MIENMARLDADEVSQWESFTRLVREGRKVEEIAATFGLPELAVKRVLALGNLLPRIRKMYAREEIDAATVRHLKLASKRQQDRKSGVSGKRVSVRLDHGGRRIINKKKQK